MSYKITGALKKAKKYMVVYIAIWVLIVLLVIIPMGVGAGEAKVNGVFDFGMFIEHTFKYLAAPFSAFSQVFKASNIGSVFGILWKFTAVYIIVLIIGIIRNAPKTEYEDIEHGSSDWATNGEQYRILSDKKGIILGENNYLPVDKRGNVNVLVVGRIWIW